MIKCRTCGYECCTMDEYDRHMKRYHDPALDKSRTSSQRIEKQKKCVKCGTTEEPLIVSGNYWICVKCTMKDRDEGELIR